MQEIYALLKQAYASELAKNCTKETEHAIAAFEEKYSTRLPSDYRTLLTQFGAMNFSEEPHLYSLSDLEWAYPAFMTL